MKKYNYIVIEWHKDSLNKAHIDSHYYTGAAL